MTFLTRAKAAFRALERFAEAIDADPVEDLRRRVARLEREAVEHPVCPRPTIDGPCKSVEQSASH